MASEINLDQQGLDDPLPDSEDRPHPGEENNELREDEEIEQNNPSENNTFVHDEGNLSNLEDSGAYANKPETIEEKTHSNPIEEDITTVNDNENIENKDDAHKGMIKSLNDDLRTASRRTSVQRAFDGKYSFADLKDIFQDVANPVKRERRASNAGGIPVPPVNVNNRERRHTISGLSSIPDAFKSRPLSLIEQPEDALVNKNQASMLPSQEYRIVVGDKTSKASGIDLDKHALDSLPESYDQTQPDTDHQQTREFCEETLKLSDLSEKYHEEDNSIVETQKEEVAHNISNNDNTMVYNDETNANVGTAHKDEISRISKHMLFDGTYSFADLKAFFEDFANPIKRQRRASDAGRIPVPLVNVNNRGRKHTISGLSSIPDAFKTRPLSLIEQDALINKSQASMLPSQLDLDKQGLDGSLPEAEYESQPDVSNQQTREVDEEREQHSNLPENNDEESLDSIVEANKEVAQSTSANERPVVKDAGADANMGAADKDVIGRISKQILFDGKYSFADLKEKFEDLSNPFRRKRRFSDGSAILTVPANVNDRARRHTISGFSYIPNAFKDHDLHDHQNAERSSSARRGSLDVNPERTKESKRVRRHSVSGTEFRGLAKELKAEEKLLDIESDSSEENEEPHALSAAALRFLQSSDGKVAPRRRHSLQPGSLSNDCAPRRREGRASLPTLGVRKQPKDDEKKKASDESTVTIILDQDGQINPDFLSGYMASSEMSTAASNYSQISPGFVHAGKYTHGMQDRRLELPGNINIDAVNARRATVPGAPTSDFNPNLLCPLPKPDSLGGCLALSESEWDVGQKDAASYSSAIYNTEVTDCLKKEDTGSQPINVDFLTGGVKKDTTEEKKVGSHEATVTIIIDEEGQINPDFLSGYEASSEMSTVASNYSQISPVSVDEGRNRRGFPDRRHSLEPPGNINIDAVIARRATVTGAPASDFNPNLLFPPPLPKPNSLGGYLASSESERDVEQKYAASYSSSICNSEVTECLKNETSNKDTQPINIFPLTDGRSVNVDKMLAPDSNHFIAIPSENDDTVFRMSEFSVDENKSEQKPQKETSHGILMKTHGKKMDSKVHFDDENLSKILLFSQPDSDTSLGSEISLGNKEEEIDLDIFSSSDEADSDENLNVTVGSPSRKKRRRFNSYKPSSEALSPHANSSPIAVQTPGKGNKQTQKRVVRSVPHISPTVVTEMVQNIQPLLMEGLLYIDGQRQMMERRASLSQEISQLLTTLIQRAVTEEESGTDEEASQTLLSGYSVDNTDSSYSAMSQLDSSHQSIALPGQPISDRRHTVHTDKPTSELEKQSDDELIVKSMCTLQQPQQTGPEQTQKAPPKPNITPEGEGGTDNLAQTVDEDHLSADPYPALYPDHLSAKDILLYLLSDPRIVTLTHYPKHCTETPCFACRIQRPISVLSSNLSSILDELEDNVRDSGEEDSSTDTDDRNHLSASPYPSLYPEELSLAQILRFLLNDPRLLTSTAYRNISESGLPCFCHNKEQEESAAAESCDETETMPLKCNETTEHKSSITKTYESNPAVIPCINGTDASPIIDKSAEYWNLMAKITSMERLMQSYPNNFNTEIEDVSGEPKVTTSQLLSLLWNVQNVSNEITTDIVNPLAVASNLAPLTKSNVQESQRAKIETRSDSVIMNPASSGICVMLEENNDQTSSQERSAKFESRDSNRASEDYDQETTSHDKVLNNYIITQHDHVPIIQAINKKKQGANVPFATTKFTEVDPTMIDSSNIQEKELSPKPHKHLEASTSSLPGSRGPSPNPDSIPSGRRSALGSDMRHMLVDKEVNESQLRTLQLENSSLQAENKLLKEKYNRAQGRILNLEKQLLSLQNGSDDLGDDMSSYMRKSREEGEAERRALEDRVVKLSRDLQATRSDKEALERQLSSVRTSTELQQHGGDKSLLIQSFRIQLNAIKEEIAKVRRVNEDAERERVAETERKKEAEARVIKLTELKSMLQQQLDNSAAGGVAEKQVKSLEKRLKITEDRLYQERSDRAGKLSQVEEKLLMENSQLQVQEKELKRQLAREKERTHTQENKYRECRDENDRLRTLAAQNSASHSGISGFDWATLRDSVTSQKKARADFEAGEEKLAHFQRLLDDSRHEKQLLQDTLAHEIQTLLRDKHAAQAQALNLEDLNAALTEEKQSLVNSMTTGSTSTPTQAKPQSHSSASEVEALRLRGELDTARASVQQQTRRIQILEAETESMRVQLRAKELALNEALDEFLRGDGGASAAVLTQLQEQQQRTAVLTAQVENLQRDVEAWREKYANVTQERQVLEDDVTNLRKQMSRVSFTPDGRMVDTVTESQKLALETEVKEKDKNLVKLNVNYQETENALQRQQQEKQEREQELNSLETQIEQLRQELRRRDRQLAQNAADEERHLVEVATLQQNLAGCNTQLDQLQHELKAVSIENSSSQAHVARLDENRRQCAAPEDLPLLDTLHQTESRTRMLQTQVEDLKLQIQRREESHEEVIGENTQLQSQCRRGQQQLVVERAQMSKLTSDKYDTHHKQQVVEEEKNYLQEEKNRLEVALVRQEEHVRHVTEQLQQLANQNVTDIESTYPHLESTGKQIAIELGTCRRLLDAREKEIQLLKDSVSRQKHELQSSKQKIMYAEDENAAMKKNLERLSEQLTSKMKEKGLVSDDTTESLSSERTKLQLTKLQLERDAQRDRETLQLKAAELSTLQSKLEKTESKQRQTENQLHQKETQLVAIETELRHQVKALVTLEADKKQLEEEIEQYQEEMRNLSGLNNSLEQRLSLEKSSHHKEKTDRDGLSDDLAATTAQLEALKRKHDVSLHQLSSEQQAVRRLKDRCTEAEEEMERLAVSEQQLRTEIDQLSDQLQHAHQQNDSLVSEKHRLQQEVQDLTATLADRDGRLYELSARTEANLQSLRDSQAHQNTQNLLQLQTLRQHVEEEREKVEGLQDQLKRKEAQLDVYMETNTKMEGYVKLKYELENEISKLEYELNETKRTHARLAGEHSQLNEQFVHLQENRDNLKETNEDLRSELKELREHSTQEASQIRTSVQEEKFKADTEKADLQEKLSKALADLRAAEASLVVVEDSREALSTSLQSAERSLVTLRTQVYEEGTAHKLAEQRAESLHTQLQGYRNERNGISEKSSDLQTHLSQTKEALAKETEAHTQLRHLLDKAEMNVTNLEARLQHANEQIEDIKSENKSMKGQLESVRQELGGKNQRLSLEMQQHIDNYDHDRAKLVAQAEQLAADLDNAREKIAAKNRENLQLQEQLLTTEGNLREKTRELKQYKESLTNEEQTRDKLERKNMEFELLLTKLRAKYNDNKSYELNNIEVQKMLNDMRQKMQSQLESQKGTDSDALAKERKRIEELRKRLSCAESQLSQEQALHIVSTTQLQTVEDDNQRLRTQVAALRRRLAASNTSDADRAKSRIEEINEIIAMSQLRARQLLAAGGSLDDSLKLNSTTTPLNLDLSSTMPHSSYRPMTSSPRPVLESDISFGTPNKMS